MSEQAIDQKRGTSVRKMRNAAITLWVITFVVVIFLAIYAVMKTGVVPELEKSPMGLYLAIVAIRLFVFDKKKLDTFKPWYRSELGWSVFILSITLLSLAPALYLIVSK